MDQKLVEAIMLRIKAGYSKEKIEEEVLATGHTEESFLEAYNEALKISGKPVSADDVNIIKSESLIDEETKSEVDIVKESALEPVTVEGEEFISFGNLFSASWKLAVDNLSLLVKTVSLFIGFSLAFLILGYLLIELSSFPVLSVLWVLIPVAVIVYILFSVTCFSNLTRSILKRDENYTFFHNFGWTLANIVSLILVGIYVEAITQVGYIFFIVPGLILSIYLVFANFYVLNGDEKGIDALVRSSKLVYGRFINVFVVLTLSFLVLATSFVLAMVLIMSIAFIQPLLLPIFIILAVAFILFSIYWQLCLTIVLFESLEKLPRSKQILFSEKTVANVYKAVVGIAVLIIFLIVSILGSATIEYYLDSSEDTHSFTGKDIVNDIKMKRELNKSFKSIVLDLNETMNYEDVCAEVSLPKGAKCDSVEGSYALEIPLSWGYYCLDNHGHNEVFKRSAIKDGLCQKKTNDQINNDDVVTF